MTESSHVRLIDPSTGTQPITVAARQPIADGGTMHIFDGRESVPFDRAGANIRAVELSDELHRALNAHIVGGGEPKHLEFVIGILCEHDPDMVAHIIDCAERSDQNGVDQLEAGLTRVKAEVESCGLALDLLAQFRPLDTLEQAIHDHLAAARDTLNKALDQVTGDFQSQHLALPNLGDTRVRLADALEGEQT